MGVQGEAEQQARGVGCLGRTSKEQDLPPTALADPDSLFVSVGDTTVHFKEAWPRVSYCCLCIARA